MTDKLDKKTIISEHMSKLGKKAGEVNKKKGSAYFKWVRSHGHTKEEDTADKTADLLPDSPTHS